MNRETILRKEIANLCSEYGFIEDTEFIVNTIFIAWRNKQSTDISDLPIEIIELILLLKYSKKESLEVSGIAKVNEKGVTKGQLLKSTITSQYFIENIEKWLYVYFNESCGGRYDDLGIDYKDINEWGEYDKYTDEELYTILKDEKEKKELRTLYYPKNKNPFYGKIFLKWYEKLESQGVFFYDNKQLSTNKKYKFLYECMILIGEFPKDDEKLDADKSTKVRDCIKAYKKRIGLV